MTTDMGRAMQEAFERQEQKRRDARAFQPDPDLERLGRQLDQLREAHPDQYRGTGLARARSQVAAYRQRKLAHEEEAGT